MRNCCIWLVLSVLCSTFLSCEHVDIEYDTTPIEDWKTSGAEYIAVFGDIQYYTNSYYINLYNSSVGWLENQLKLGARFNCVLHTGDITQENEVSAYDLFSSSTAGLADKVLYVSAIGDHDYAWQERIYIYDREDSHFSEYMNFPKTVNNIVAQYEPDRMDNIVVQNTIHGQRYDILSLEFGPRKEVVEWADKYVSEHPDIKFILINHEYLDSGGGIRTKNLKCEARIRWSSYSTPTELWDNLIRKNDNIAWVLCGHVGSLYAYTPMVNDFGREVPQIEHNIQSNNYRYDGWLMLWEFPAEGDMASVSIINTRRGNFYEDNRKLITFQYKY